MKGSPPIPLEAERALNVLRAQFTRSLVAVYLHGSALAGGLRPDSDVDLIVVLDQPMTNRSRSRLAGALMQISRPPGGPSGRPLEVIVFRRADLTASAFPARSEFIFGEWLRRTLEAGQVPEPEAEPEFTLLLAQARREARALVGPGPAEVLPAIPDEDLRRATADALPALLDRLDGDERNALLTLARMWRTLATGEFVPKDVAAEWAMARLPIAPAAVIARAREGYLGLAKEDWRDRQDETWHAADILRSRIRGFAIDAAALGDLDRGAGS